MPPQPVVIAGEHLKLLSLLGVGLQSAQMNMIGPQKFRQYIRIKRIALGLAHAKPIPGPIQRLGIDRIDHHSMIQKKIHDPPVGLLDGCPKLYSSALRSCSQRPNSLMPLGLCSTFISATFLPWESLTQTW